MKNLDLKTFLQNSVFYPSSGIDGLPLKMLNVAFRNFVYVDYDYSKKEVYRLLDTAFKYIGYQHSGVHSIDMHEIFRKDYKTYIEKTEIENEKYLTIPDKQEDHFSLYAEYRLIHGTQKNMASNFSILHIHQEAIKTFYALYLRYQVNPKVICVINPGNYGNNWTEYINKEHALYKVLQRNTIENRCSMPEYLLTKFKHNTNDNFWPDYSHTKNIFNIKDNFNLYRYSKKEIPTDPKNDYSTISDLELECLSNMSLKSIGIDDVYLWFGPNPHESVHRIKISNEPHTMSRTNCFTIELPNYTIKGTINDSFITKEKLNRIIEYVKKNETLIIDYSDSKIATDTFFNKIQ